MSELPCAGPLKAHSGNLHKKDWITLGGLCLLALLARLLVFHFVVHREPPVYRYQDSAGYLATAQSLQSGKGFLDSEGRPEFWWPPGYPVFLAATFAARIATPNALEGVLLAQIILSTLIVAMSFMLGFALGGRSAAILSAALMVFEPSSLAYANVILSETLFTFVLVLCVLCWRRWWVAPNARSLALASILVAAMPFIRPLALYLWIPLLIFSLILGPTEGSRLRPAGFFLAIAILPAALWTLRNYNHLGIPEFATVGQYNEARFARAVEDLAGVPETKRSTKQPWETGFGVDQGLPFPQLVRIRHDYFVTTILRHPVASMKRLVLTGLGILGVPDGRLAAMILPKAPTFEGDSIAGRLRFLRRAGWLGALQLLGMVVSVGGFVSIPLLALRSRRWTREKKILLLLLVLLVLYQLLISSFIMFQGERFRVPVIPLLAVLLGCAFAGSLPSRGAGPGIDSEFVSAT